MPMPGDVTIDTSAALSTLSDNLFPTSREGDNTDTDTNTDDEGGAAGSPASPNGSPASPTVSSGTPTAPATPTTTTATAPTATPTTPTASTPTTPTRDLTKAPNTWVDGPAKTNFAALDEGVRAEIHRREEDMFKGIEQYRASAEVGKQFERVLQPHMADLAKAGIHPARQVEALLGAHRTLVFGSPAEKVELFTRLGRDYGVDVSKLAPVPADQQPYLDPAVKALQDELNSVKNSIQSNESKQRSIALAEQQRVVETFFKDPANIHAQTVGGRMVQLLEHGTCPDLKTAYETAVWENPVTRKAEIDRQTAEASASAATAEAARVDAAKKAQSANVKASAKHGKGGTAASAGASMADTIAETLKEIKAREEK